MNWLKRLFGKPVLGFVIGMTGVFLLTAGLRFWELNRLNTLVFDEAYYAKYANNYLIRISFADAHPPLGKYLIAIGIWLSQLNPFDNDNIVQNRLTGSLLAPVSYRWMNALTGSLIPFIVAGIAYQLNRRHSYALIAALFTAVDGLLLVESRYALINIYLLFFGLVGQWFFLLALNGRGWLHRFWLALAGICFGAAITVKWNGLGFLLGIYLIWLLAWAVYLFRSERLAAHNSVLIDSEENSNLPKLSASDTLLQNLTRLNPLHLMIDLGIVPALVYRLLWIPHLQINSALSFWTIHKIMLVYHQHTGRGLQEHQYCSSWYTWPWIVRPVVYFFEKANNTSSVTSQSASLVTKTEELIYDVHGMGNPVLWWLSTVGILVGLGLIIGKIAIWTNTRPINANQRPAPLIKIPEFGIALYLIVNYATNLLPWARVTRCTFLYHYMGAAVFSFLTLAWLVDSWLRSYHYELRAVGVTVIFLILLAFVFWLPVYLGLPLSLEGFQVRMWFRSWI
jgi:dolichyl-phosphate-mannose-protein mannosyltransferase